MPDKYQVIILEFADGSELVTAIRARFKEGDPKPIIVGYQVTEPREIESGYRWATIEDLSENSRDEAGLIGEPCSCGEGGVPGPHHANACSWYDCTPEEVE